MKKILFATIVPFWNRETGAQQRIFSMVKALMTHGHQVRIFFPGHAESSDHAAADQLGLDVAFHRSDQASSADESFAGRIKWQMDALKHAVENLAGGRDPADDHKGPLKLSDFRWPWAEDAFKKTVIEFAAQAIVCEYITMAYLVESIPVDLRSKIHCLVDTHDLLSRRQQVFTDHGQPHWIAVSEEEEAAALRAFDTIIAIQDDEANTFSKMAPGRSVIVVGHQTLGADASECKTSSDPEVFTLGYLGSSNASNVDGVNEFLDVVWRDLQDQPRIRLVVAGNVSNEVVPEFRFGNVELLGRVGDVSDFYASVDAVINPVGYGTGLKIKSVEAIAYGKPLLCTTAGWVGSTAGSVTVVPQLSAMREVIVQWLKDRQSFEEVRLAACAQAKRSVVETYRPLLELLE